MRLLTGESAVLHTLQIRGSGSTGRLAWYIHETAAGEVRRAPVRQAEGALEARGRGEGVARPGEEGVALGDDPVRRPVEVEDREGCRRGLGGDEGCYGGAGGYALVEEGDAEGGAGEGREEGEGGLGLRVPKGQFSLCNPRIRWYH